MPVTDPKCQGWLRKLLGALDVPSDAAEVRFTLGDKPAVT